MSHLNESQFGIDVKLFGIGHTDKRPYNDAHAANSSAGKWFHLDFVESVCVYDAFGITQLYLKKNPDGTVYREKLNRITGLVDKDGVNKNKKWYKSQSLPYPG